MMLLLILATILSFIIIIFSIELVKDKKTSIIGFFALILGMFFFTVSSYNLIWSIINSI